MEWLGEVPEHWGVKPIRRVISVPLSNGIFKKKEEFGEGVLLVNVFDIYRPDFKVDFGALDRVNCDPSETLSYEVLSGDLFFVRSSLKQEGIAVVAMAGSCAEPVVFECHLIRARPNRQVLDGRFGSYVLNSVVYRATMVAKAKITTMTTIDQEAILSTLLPIPSVAEQTHIAAFLDRETAKIDGLVGEQRRLMELLKEKRQAVISHAVTQGLNPHAAMKPSGIEWLGDVPTHWEVSRMANVFREVVEAGTDELPILSVSIHHGVSDKEIDEEDMDRKVTRSDDRSKYKRVSRGDLVYNMMRAWQGGFGTVTVAGMVSPAYVVARPRTPMETAYIEHLLRTPQAIEQMRRHSRGVTDFRLRLYWDEFKNLGVTVPPQKETIAICAKIAEMEERLSKLAAACERSIDLLQERRAALISAAVTGEIDARKAV